MAFKDYFSKQANLYSKYRPHYPAELYAFLSSLTPQHHLVWDCGTGNGQAAGGLTKYYQTVVATDPSAEQIRNAMPGDRIQYRVEKAEQSSLTTGSLDLVTVANAMHWFDLDQFYREVNRVLKPGGILAAWCYGTPHAGDDVVETLGYFHNEVLGGYWRPENRLVELEYSTIQFPFKPIGAPQFCASRTFDLEEFLMYLRTWSAVQRYIGTMGTDPTLELSKRLRRSWVNKTEKREVSWKLCLKVGSKLPHI